MVYTTVKLCAVLSINICGTWPLS